jgi:starch synthase (maltosyl-transferring)
MSDVIGRIVIDDVRPRTPTGQYPAKAVVGETVTVSADVFRDGHDILGARVCWRPLDSKSWNEAPMTLITPGLDLWQATIEPTTLGMHELVVEAWTDAYATWRHKIRAKLDAGQDVDVELEEGARLMEARAESLGMDGGHLRTVVQSLRNDDATPQERVNAALGSTTEALMQGPQSEEDVTSSEPVRLWVDRERALVGAWYELFPRSYGGFQGVIDRLPAVAEMGFDVVYLPPIHPIGRQFRKGKNNTLTPTADDVGSPWAIGGPEGGHTAIEPSLGTMTDFEAMVAKAHELGMEIALDYALQCSPDHPWVTEHPEWFHKRPDGTIAYAENPPKKYQDIYPINFWPETGEKDRVALWEACKEILDFWIARGIRIFRVDNPHTKPMAFWEWVIPAVQAEHPEVLFLAEAFTRPKVMSKLAEVGFSQSYTYFTWRTTRLELTEYTTEVATSSKADYMRPNFWPNTPDILAAPLRNGNQAVFKLRLLLAATLVPSYGVYSGYELLENEPMSETNEEYFHSEKYEIKQRNWNDPRSIAPYMARINSIRRRHPALQQLRNIQFHHTNNESMIAYSKVDGGGDVVLVVVNLDPWQAQEATLTLDLTSLGMPWDGPYEAYDEITGQAFPWWGPNPYVRLDPAVEPAHVLHLRALS